MSSERDDTDAQYTAPAWKRRASTLLTGVNAVSLGVAGLTVGKPAVAALAIGVGAGAAMTSQTLDRSYLRDRERAQQARAAFLERARPVWSRAGADGDLAAVRQAEQALRARLPAPLYKEVLAFRRAHYAQTLAEPARPVPYPGPKAPPEAWDRQRQLTTAVQRALHPQPPVPRPLPRHRHTP